jgi:UDP-glucose 4-epimerase
MKVLVTGGAGFIGSFLVERLVGLGHQVVVIDYLTRGSRENLSRIVDSIDLIEADVSEDKVVDIALEGCHIAYHLAGMSQVMTSVRQPDLCFKYNMVGTYKVAKACVAKQVKLVFTSSREVYGNIERLPATEDDKLMAVNPYGASKIAGESIIRAYANTYDLDFVILRLANVVGPKDFGRVIPILLKQCLVNGPLTLFGGHQILDFVGVLDVIEALIQTQDTSGVTVNIGSGVGVNIVDLANLLKRLTGSRSEIVFADRRQEEVERFTTDISLAQKLLGWKPKTSLEDTIKWVIKSGITS